MKTSVEGTKKFEFFIARQRKAILSAPVVGNACDVRIDIWFHLLMVEPSDFARKHTFRYRKFRKWSQQSRPLCLFGFLTPFLFTFCILFQSRFEIAQNIVQEEKVRLQFENSVVRTCWTFWLAIMDQRFWPNSKGPNTKLKRIVTHKSSNCLQSVIFCRIRESG